MRDTCTVEGCDAPGGGSSMIGTAAAELWDQLCFLSDPTTKWVRRVPRSKSEACAVSRYTKIHVNSQVLDILEEALCLEDTESASWWNDNIAGSRDEVLWVLREAYELAVWLDE